MAETEHADVVWTQTLDWIMREHEETLDAAAQAALRDWLAAEPAHRRAYAEARALWLLTGLIPTADEQQNPPAGGD